MVNNLDWIIKELKNYVKNTDIDMTINVTNSYSTKKINNPKIFVNEMKHNAVDFTNNGERKTLIGLQFDIFCGSVKISNKNENGATACRYLAEVVDDFMSRKFKARRVSFVEPRPTLADDTNEYFSVLRYEYIYDTVTNTIYRQ